MGRKTAIFCLLAIACYVSCNQETNQSELSKKDHAGSNSVQSDDERIVGSSSARIRRQVAEGRQKENRPEKTLDGHSDSFYDLVVRRKLFVDRSLLIKEILDADASMITVRRPKGWGKTVNMDMMKRFFEIEVDPESGQVAAPDESANRKLFIGGEVDCENGERRLLKPLKIATAHPDIVEQHQGKYPVVYVSFKEIVGSTYNESEQTAEKVIADLFRSHRYLLRKLNDPKSIDKFKSYIDSSADVRQLQDGIRFLCDLLFGHHGRRVLLLIDDQDTPIHHLWLQLNNGLETVTVDAEKSKQLERLLDLFGGLLVLAVRNTTLVQKTIVSGCSMNNLLFPNALDRKLENYYGFAESEVHDLIGRRNGSRETGNRIKSSFCSYQFGTDRQVCNPFFVLRSVLGTSIDRIPLPAVIRQELLSDWFQPVLQELAMGWRVSFVLAHVVDFTNIGAEDRLTSLLAFYGYLSVTDVDKDRCIVRASNNHLKRFYQSALEEKLQQATRSIRNGYRLADYLFRMDLEHLQDILNQYMTAYVKNIRVAGDDLLNFYRAILGAFLTGPGRISALSQESATFGTFLLEPIANEFSVAAIIAINTDRCNEKTVAEKFLNTGHKQYEQRLLENSHIFTIFKVCITFENFYAIVRL